MMSIIAGFAKFSIAVARFLVLEGRLDTRLYLYSILIFFKVLLSS